MADSARLFVGLELGGEARRALSAFRCELEGRVAGRLVDPSLYHLTLCFLGQTPRGCIPMLCALLDELDRRPFALSFGGLGTFKNGSILWLGIEQPCPELHELRRALADSLNAAGFPVDRGAYSPHITLGRQARALCDLPEPPKVTFPIAHVTLFESTRVDGRLCYLPLYRSGLSG